MKNLSRILIPTDFSETSLLAVKEAAFMARLCKADLYLLHAIEIAETTYSVYNPAVSILGLEGVEALVNEKLNDLAGELREEYAITVKILCSWGKVPKEIVSAVREYDIDIVVMGTHGASGFDEFFIGSNAQKTVAVCPCPVITIRSKTRLPGFTKLVLPIDNSFTSRRKVNTAIAFASHYAAKVYILGLLHKDEKTDRRKMQIKLAAVEKTVERAGLPHLTKIVSGENLALSAMKYSKKVKADLVAVLTNHESHLGSVFPGVFSKQIINHSKIPVMSIKAS